MNTTTISKTKLSLAISLLLAASGFAQVEVARIILFGVNNTGNDWQYSVPQGKVLIIEHVFFTNSWDRDGIEKKLTLKHYGPNASGISHDTTLPFPLSWNQLLRPLKLGEGMTVANTLSHAIPTRYRIALYGTLLDTTDLYAGVKTEVDDLKLASTGTSATATAKLASPRPSKVTVKTSTDMKNFQEDPSAKVTSIDPSTKEIKVDFPANTERLFVKTETKTRPKEPVVPPIAVAIPFP